MKYKIHTGTLPLKKRFIIYINDTVLDALYTVVPIIGNN